MPSRLRKIGPVCATPILCALLLSLLGCGEARPQDPTPGTTDVTVSSHSAPSSPGEVVPGTSAESLTSAWAASVAAVHGLGPVRVTVVETAEGRVSEGGTAPDAADTWAQITEVEQLLDPPGGRARQTVRGPDGSLETTVVNGRERITLTGGSGTVTTGLVSYSRYVTLEPPAGLPLPLWAGSPVPPRQGYVDILGEPSGGDGVPPASGFQVEKLAAGGYRLAWERSAEGWTSAWTVLLDANLLPLRVEVHSEGEMPGEGEMSQGAKVEYALSVTYSFEKSPAFSSADFTLDAPEHYWRRGVTYELSTERPWSGHADWGQYWLGDRVDEWALVSAQHVSFEDDPDQGAAAEPGDEFISLIYDRPGALSVNETIQVMVRPLRGRVVEDSRAFAEQRVASGTWVRTEMTLAGESAVVYSGAWEGGPNDRADSVFVFLPDAFVKVDLWAPVDPRIVLESIQRVR